MPSVDIQIIFIGVLLVQILVFDKMLDVSSLGHSSISTANYLDILDTNGTCPVVDAI